MTRPPVELDVRKAIPKAWKAAALERSGGTCAYPDCDVTAPLEYDHMLCLALGGKHQAENIQPLCVPHHRAKTDLDIKMVARSRRCAGETGQRARRDRRGAGSIKSAGFGPRSRKFDGTVSPTKRALREANDQP